MVFPKVTFDIFEFFLINLSSTEIHSNVFIIVIFSEELAYRIDRVAVKFLNSRGWKCHSDYSISDVCKIKIEAIFFVSIFRSTNDFSKKVHFRSLEFI